MVAQRFAAGEAETITGPPPGLPRLGLLTLDVPDQPALPASAVGLGEARVDQYVESERLAHDLGRLGGPPQIASIKRADSLAGDRARQLMRLLETAFVEWRIAPSHDSGRRLVVRGFAVPREQNHSPPWNSLSVSARRPTRSVSSEIASWGGTLPRLTADPRRSMNQTCWDFFGASK